MTLGNVWPGPCIFPDYTHEHTRHWWAKLVRDFIANGVDGIWNDMNEPAVFKARFWSAIRIFLVMQPAFSSILFIRRL